MKNAGPGKKSKGVKAPRSSGPNNQQWTRLEARSRRLMTETTALHTDIAGFAKTVAKTVAATT